MRSAPRRHEQTATRPPSSIAAKQREAADKPPASVPPLRAGCNDAPRKQQQYSSGRQPVADRCESPPHERPPANLSPLPIFCCCAALLLLLHCGPADCCARGGCATRTAGGSVACAHLLVEDWLGLPTETRLLVVVPALTCERQHAARPLSVPASASAQKGLA
eukprot:4082145-Prymnesium_polylepis.2